MGAEITVWPLVALAIVALAFYAIKSGTISMFSMSKAGGVTFSKTQSDITFMTNVNTAIEEIDNVCKVNCWRHVLSNEPGFLNEEQQYQVKIHLLEIISFNHILRNIYVSGFRVYVHDNCCAIINKTDITKRVQLEKFLAILVDGLLRNAKVAASKKIEVYESNLERKDLSEACKLVLSDKIEKNKLYLQLSLEYITAIDKKDDEGKRTKHPSAENS